MDVFRKKPSGLKTHNDTGFWISANSYGIKVQAQAWLWLDPVLFPDEEKICQNYIKTPPVKTILRIQLEHFNTISSKSLLDVFRTLQPINELGKALEVEWYYESDDEELLDAGQTYQEITGLPFRMVPY
mgnify:CR=1 FL=1